MKLVINKNQLKEAPEQFLRSSGYAYIRDRQTGYDSYVKRLGSYHYPRLHMYVKYITNKKQETMAEFNLHLDHKQASYAGSFRHNAEYNGEIVEQEIERLRNLLRQKKASPSPEIKKTEDSIGHGRIENDLKNIENKNKLSWWRKIFNK